MVTSKKGRSLIKESESLRLEAYLDPVGIPTIGWGHTKNVKMGQSITVAQAEIFLTTDLVTAENVVLSLKHSELLTQGEFDALVSFVFNLGGPKFLTGSTLRRRIDSLLELRVEEDELLDDIEYQFSRWKYGGGRVLPGLVTRRRKEALLFITGHIIEL